VKGLAVIVLAAGLGTRMKSSTAKVLHQIAGRPMLLHTLGNALALKPEKTVAVVGHQAEKVIGLLPEGVTAAIQKEQLGTAHAASAGLKKLGGFTGALLLCSGDTPLLGADTFRRLVQAHQKAGADVSVLTAHLADPAGYGRIIRGGDGSVQRIVEHKDATAAERAVHEINTGTYCFKASALKRALKEVRTENSQGEFYLTDVVAITKKRGGTVLGVTTDRPEEALGINSRVDLANAEKTVRRRVNERHMRSGVTIIDPDATYIDAGVMIGADTVIHPGNHITGETVIGSGVALFPGNFILDSTLKDGAVVKGYSVIESSCVDEGAQIGPFSHLRPGSRVGAAARVGNFVELKKALLAEGVKASHLSYLGDTVIGRDVNIGAGTITCNYDGFNKYQTIIEDGVFVGSDTQFIAPVRVGRGSVVAAGTTVTKDVPADALAISRSPQVNREGWARKNRQEKAKGKKA
jgi:bifunctional UDP-N-acetylglucosamine pyrophosphorylase / glucosamine-1-phosphate N-acetyltransferase